MDFDEQVRNRLVKTILSKNPVAVAVSSYKVILDSSVFKEYKEKNDIKRLKEVVENSILRLATILSLHGWKDEDIDKFTGHSKELFKYVYDN